MTWEMKALPLFPAPVKLTQHEYFRFYFYAGKNMKRIILYCLAMVMMGTACKKTEDAPGTAIEPAKELKNVAYGSDAMQNMDVYLPAGRSAGTTKAVILVHGGGWVGGDKADMNDAVNALKTLLPDYAIFNINYRLATLPSGNLWPTQLNDVNAAVDFIVSKSSEYKFNSGKMAIGGASAGAHLALLKAYKHNAGNLKAVIDMFGPTDMQDLYTRNASYQPLLTIFMNGTPVSNPVSYSNASPLFAVHSGVTPTLILHGTADNVVPISQSDSLDNRLANAGVAKLYVKYPLEGHGIWSAPNNADAFARIAAFINLHVQ
jgi:acetyl esterase/lipase